MCVCVCLVILLMCLWIKLKDFQRFPILFYASLHTHTLTSLMAGKHQHKKSHIFTRGQITAISLSHVSLSLVPALTLDFFSGKSSDIHFSSDYRLLRSRIFHTNVFHTHTHTPGSYWTLSRDTANQRG